MQKIIIGFIALGLIFFSFGSCTKKGDVIIEPYIGSYKFTTFTVDTFQLRVVVNDVILTDSLLSPVGTFTHQLEFTTDTVAKLKIINAKTNVVYIETLLKLKTGISTISIVQLLSGEEPVIPSIPNEALPANGNCKIRFQYTMPTNSSVPFFDSIQCFIRRTYTGTPITYDTFVLKQYEISKFYEGIIGSKYTISLKDPVTGELIHNGSSAFIVTNGFTDFNTSIIYGTAGVPPGPYNFRINRIY